MDLHVINFHLFRYYKNHLINETASDCENLNNYIISLQSIAEKEISNLEKQITDCTKRTIINMYKEKDNLLNKAFKILNELKQECVLNDEIISIEKIIERKNPEEIGVLMNFQFKSKYVYKDQRITYLYKIFSDIKNCIRNFIIDCENNSKNFQSWNSFKVNKLEKLWHKHFEEYISYGEKAYEKYQELNDLKNKSKEYISQNNELKKQNEALDERLKKLQKVHEELEEFIFKLNNQIDELKTNREFLECNIDALNNQIKSLESITKEKEEIYNKLSNTLPSPETHKKSEEMKFKESTSLFYSTVVFGYNQTNEILDIYHIAMNKSLSFSSNKLNIPSNHGSVQIQDDFYIAGGYDSNLFNFLNKTIKIKFVDLEYVKTENKAPLITHRSQNKLLLFDFRTIYCLGGKSSGMKLLKSCERYNITQDKWEIAPNLNEGKFNISAVTMNETCIYVFSVFLTVRSKIIECLNPKQPSAKWKIIKFKKSEVWNRRDQMGCFQISENEVIIFGGIENFTGCTNEIGRAHV